jgi:hypothetical protein
VGKDRYYSEQYLLAASLLAGNANFDVILPNAFIESAVAAVEFEVVELFLALVPLEQPFRIDADNDSVADRNRIKG